MAFGIVKLMLVLLVCVIVGDSSLLLYEFLFIVYTFYLPRPWGVV